MPIPWSDVGGDIVCAFTRRDVRALLTRCACVALLLTPLAFDGASAQESAEIERSYSLIAHLGAGGAYSMVVEQTVPDGARESTTGLSLMGRVLWRPGHLLGIGVQSGFTRVSTLRTDASENAVNLSAVPAMFVVAMGTAGFEASVATGWQRYIVGTEGRAISSSWEMCYSVAAGYEVYTAGDFGIGAEVSFTSMPERDIDIIALQLRCRYAFTY